MSATAASECLPSSASSSISSSGSPSTALTRYLSPDLPLPYGRLSSSPSYYELSSWPADPLSVFCSWYLDAENDYDQVQHAHEAVHWPNTIQIATVDAEGFPHSRTVLLKGVEERGLVFFTNYNSDKGKDIAATGAVSVNIYWKSLERQIRIEGRAVKVSEQVSDLYFHRRPLASQLSAIVSAQSSVIEDRLQLEQRYLHAVKELAQRIKQIRASSSVSVPPPNFSPLVYPASVSHSEEAGPVYESALNILSEYEKELSASSNHSLLELQQRLFARPAHWGGYVILPSKLEFWCNGRYRLHSRIVYQTDKAEDDTTPTKHKKWTKKFLSP